MIIHDIWAIFFDIDIVNKSVYDANGNMYMPT